MRCLRVTRVQWNCVGVIHQPINPFETDANHPSSHNSHYKTHSILFSTITLSLLLLLLNATNKSPGDVISALSSPQSLQPHQETQWIPNLWNPLIQFESSVVVRWWIEGFAWISWKGVIGNRTQTDPTPSRMLKLNACTTTHHHTMTRPSVGWMASVEAAAGQVHLYIPEQ